MLRIVSLMLLATALQAASGTDRIKNLLVDLRTDIVLPQVASGGGWKTTFVLVNMDGAASRCMLIFVKSDGSAMQLNIAGTGRVGTLEMTIPAFGSRIVETVDEGTVIEQGWALLSTDGVMGTAGRVSGMAILRLNVPGRAEQEAVVPFSTFVEGQCLMTFDNTGGFSTGIALVNSDLVEATVNVEFIDMEGNVIHQGSLVLPPFGHTAFSIPVLFPEVANQRGTVFLQSTFLQAPDQHVVNQYMAALGLRFNPAGSFTSSHSLSLPEWNQ